MKVLKYFIYVLLAVAAIYLALCAFGPKKFATSKSIEIDASSDAVFEEVSDFNRWSAWSPWHKYDPKMVNTYTGEPGTVGHKNSWTSTEMGNGSQEIVEIEPGKSVKTALRFEDFKDAVSYASYMVEPKGEKTLATWTMDGSDLPFLVRGLMLLMGGQKGIDKDYEEGLASLKKIAEAKPKQPTVSFEIIELPDQWYVGKRFPAINEAEVDSNLFGSTYGELGKAIGGMDKITGMPFSIGHSYDYATKMMDLEIALPVAAEMKVPAGLTCVKIPAGRAAKHVFYGPYEQTAMAWEPLMQAITKEYKPRWSGYEVYVNDPTTVKSVSEIETWLIVPIE